MMLKTRSVDFAKIAAGYGTSFVPTSKLSMHLDGQHPVQRVHCAILRTMPISQRSALSAALWAIHSLPGRLQLPSSHSNGLSSAVSQVTSDTRTHRLALAAHDTGRSYRPGIHSIHKPFKIPLYLFLKFFVAPDIHAWKISKGNADTFVHTWTRPRLCGERSGYLMTFVHGDHGLCKCVRSRCF
ncbi:hypothetical protein BDZ97DRAFT_999023 [Flammula alnicola]|nr:hypothetical protein BDZ97DRAFT_999023 [Flammula alnicola]